MSDYIERCLNSLIIPDMSKLDILVINDGSKDDSSEKAKKIASRYPDSIRVIDKENGNYGSCINRGLKEACGKYVKILDADDTFDKENFEGFVKYLAEIDEDLVLSNVEKIDSFNKRLYLYKSELIKPNTPLGIEEILKLSKDDLISMHSFTYKTKILREIEYKQSEGISYTDTEWYFLPITGCRFISYYDKIIYRYLIGREGQTMEASIFRSKISHLIEIVKWMVENYYRVKSNMIIEIREYMETRIIELIPIIYKTIILDINKEETNKILISLDDFLSEIAPEIYSKGIEKGKINAIRFNPLNYWQKNGRRTNLYKLRFLALIRSLAIQLKG